MYEICISHEAEKYYKKLDSETKRRINKCIEVLSEKPSFGPRIRRLHGDLKGKYRYALGALRIVYEIDQETETIKIIAIKTRGDVYKK